MRTALRFLLILGTRTPALPGENLTFDSVVLTIDGAPLTFISQ